VGDDHMLEKYSKNSSGKIDTSDIPILKTNPFLIGSFVISGILSLMFGLAMALLFMFCKVNLSKGFAEYLEK
jgi:hypothetical protein